MNADLDLKSAVLHTRFRIVQSILGSLGSILVRVGWNRVIKGSCDPSELEALLYIAEHITIPVPRVRCTYDGSGGIYIVMNYIKGTNLETLWMLGLLKLEDQDVIVDDMAAILIELRALHTPNEETIASAQGGVILDYRIGSSLVGPFQSHVSFHSFLRDGVSLENTARIFGKEVAACHDKNYRTCFSHVDLAPRNIIIRNDRIVGVMDWALAD